MPTFRKIFSRRRSKKYSCDKEDNGVVLSSHNPSHVETINDKLDALIRYNHDTQEPDRPHGRGICVIFTLFTGDLPGYIADRTRAFNFFRHKLDYDVFCDEKRFTNCTQEQLLRTIKAMQLYITERATKCDRFVLIILTHGLKDGLLTCKPEDPTNTLTEHIHGSATPSTSGEPLITKIEDILACFKHDQVPALKGKPKMFLIQACRGDDVVKSACDTTTDLPQYDLSNLKLRLDIPIEADILMFHSTTPDTQSWVSQRGSWFMQRTLDVFERHYKCKHVEDMMTLVNFLIAEQRDERNGKISNAIQMSCKFSTLRMHFYL